MEIYLDRRAVRQIRLSAQEAIEEDDTVERLSARILQVEHRLYPRAVRIVLEGRYRVEGRRVRLLEG